MTRYTNHKWRPENRAMDCIAILLSINDDVRAIRKHANDETSFTTIFHLACDCLENTEALTDYMKRLQSELYEQAMEGSQP